MTTTVLRVSGMTCEHCVSAVSKELHALPGVTTVSVDLATGQVAVTADGPLDLDAAEAAVDEAGYALAR
jgi:copper chaperone CopZ